MGSIKLLVLSPNCWIDSTNINRLNPGKTINHHFPLLKYLMDSDKHLDHIDPEIPEGSDPDCYYLPFPEMTFPALCSNNST